MDNEEAALREETEKTLSRVQEYNPESLIRRDDLGKYAFSEAVEPARRAIDLFRTLPISHLQYFPFQQLEQIKSISNSFFKLLQQFEEFDVGSAEPNVADAQNDLLIKLNSQFQSIFNALAPLVAFSTARSQDFAALEQEARAATQAIKDQTDKIIDDLEKQKDAAETILAEVRAAAAEEGVSKQAIHFKNEADKHRDQANTWLTRTIAAASTLAIYAIASLFIHNIPGTMPGQYGVIQLAISKVLIFGVIAYAVLLCARNFMSHKHNQIVNRHRQNALATFTALAEATSDAASSDIVLSHAAACIFSPQETGYTKNDIVQSEGVPALQILPRIGGSASTGQ